MKKIIFVVNPISGTKEKDSIVNLIPQHFNEEDYEVLYTQHAGHATEIATRASEDGAHIVVAVGGDGTVNEVARGLTHTRTALGIIPCGSGNGLARHLGIPMKSEGALKIIAEKKIQTCDYGLICGHPFFCTAGVGFDAEVSETFAKAGKRGLLTYLKTTLTVGVAYKGKVYDIEFDDGRRMEQVSCWLVTAGNAAQYGNDFFITPDASLCDGLLDVNIWQPFNKLTTPRIGIELHSGSIHKNSNVEVVRCKKVIIHRQEESPIHWDGDPAPGPKDVTIEIVPRGIRMVVGNPSKNRL